MAEHAAGEFEMDKAPPVDQAGGEKKTRESRKIRSSSRVKKLSAAMRIVDEDTRRLVMQNRIDALEGDNLFDNLHNPDEEAELDAELARKKGSATRADVEEFTLDDDALEDSEDISDQDDGGDDQKGANKKESANQTADQVEASLFGGVKKASSKSKKQRKDPVSSKGDPATARKTRSQLLEEKKKMQQAQTQRSKSGKPAAGQSATTMSLLGKRGKRGKLDLARLFYPEYYEFEAEEQQSVGLGLFADTKIANFQNYLSIAAKPSTNSSKRFFCSVCGYWSKYACTRCGLRYCSLKCQDVHKETRCIKFAE